jgi:hypothetical protein
MDLRVLHLILYILAATCFFAFSFGREHPRVNLLGLGVFFWALVPLTQTINNF